VSAFSESRRTEVVTRAGHRCEYCHLPTTGQVATFPIDHIIPRSEGGSNDPDNLALCCPHCNAHKWIAVDGIDPTTGLTARLFHPRRDVWADHFEWSDAHFGKLVGRTPVGRATVASLRINDEGMIAVRLLLADLGLLSGQV
jgi:HNH endonuclease